jgi:hypothetical protein
MSLRFADLHLAAGWGVVILHPRVTNILLLAGFIDKKKFIDQCVQRTMPCTIIDLPVAFEAGDRHLRRSESRADVSRAVGI